AGAAPVPAEARPCSSASSCFSLPEVSVFGTPCTRIHTPGHERANRSRYGRGMELHGILYSVADGVARIVLARPEASNSFDLATASALAAAVAEAGRDETVRSVLITGDGARFCAGGDMPWAT